MMQTICQTYSDVNFKVLYDILAYNMLIVIKEFKLIGGVLV